MALPRTCHAHKRVRVRVFCSAIPQLVSLPLFSILADCISLLLSILLSPLHRAALCVMLASCVCVCVSRVCLCDTHNVAEST